MKFNKNPRNPKPYFFPGDILAGKAPMDSGITIVIVTITTCIALLVGSCEASCTHARFWFPEQMQEDVYKRANNPEGLITNFGFSYWHGFIGKL